MKVKVESFSLNHTTVQAPHVRLAETFRTPHDDLIEKYDLRFTQPNQDIMPTGAVHALEHLLAGFLREELDGIVDLSPMGCRTGFYLIRVGEGTTREIAQGLIKALEKVAQAESIPADNQIQCGNYRDMSLFGAQEYAKQVLQGLKEKYA